MQSQRGLIIISENIIYHSSIGFIIINSNKFIHFLKGISILIKSYFIYFNNSCKIALNFKIINLKIITFILYYGPLTKYENSIKILLDQYKFFSIFLVC